MNQNFSERFGISARDIASHDAMQGAEDTPGLRGAIHLLMADGVKDAPGLSDLPLGEEVSTGCKLVDGILGHPTITVFVDETGKKVDITCASYQNGNCARKGGTCGQLVYPETTVFNIRDN